MGLKSIMLGVATIKANQPKVDALKKEKPTKLNNLAIYMLGGRPVTGAIMISRFNIYSYRDAIYNLKQKGYNISSKTIFNKGVEHRLWWLSEFDEDFIIPREQKVF